MQIITFSKDAHEQTLKSIMLCVLKWILVYNLIEFSTGGHYIASL